VTHLKAMGSESGVSSHQYERIRSEQAWTDGSSHSDMSDATRAKSIGDVADRIAGQGPGASLLQLKLKVSGKTQETK